MKDFYEEGYLLEMLVKDITKKPFLTREEEPAILMKAKEGDSRSLNCLVETNMKYIIKVVLKYWSPGLPLMDMVAEGCLGILKAVEKFDPDRGLRFLTYASFWIEGGVRNYLRKQRKHNHKSLDTPILKGEDLTIEDTLSSADIQADEPVFHKQIRAWLDVLSSREKKILVLRFWNDMSLEEIGLIIGLSKERIRQYEARGLRKIRWKVTFLYPDQVSKLKAKIIANIGSDSGVL